jgi:hypothetical protein
LPRQEGDETRTSGADHGEGVRRARGRFAYRDLVAARGNDQVA